METVSLYPSSIDNRAIARAAAILRDGDVVAYPTDTLYALGCDALNNAAVESLCRLRGLDPKRNSLSVIVADISTASEYARIDNRAFRILKQYTPGPFTFILPAATTLPKVFKGRKTVGIRIPDNDIARRLVADFGYPILSTSVTDPHAVRGAELLILEEGDEERQREPSTVIDLTDSADPMIVRQGAGIFDL